MPRLVVSVGSWKERQQPWFQGQREGQTEARLAPSQPSPAQGRQPAQRTWENLWARCGGRSP